MLAGFIKLSSIFCLLCILIFNFFACSVKPLVPSDEFGAYYTKINSGEEFEKYSRTGDYADIIVDFGTENGKLVFWRGSSYLPYWETANGKWYLQEMIPRSGDGDGNMPDKVNTYSVVKIIENGPEKVVIYWRYLPSFAGTNPHIDVDATKFAEEYFEITPYGKVTRTMKEGTAKVDAWNDPLNKSVQTFSLTLSGIASVKMTKAKLSVEQVAVKGSEVKDAVVVTPVAWWKFDEGKGDETSEAIGAYNSSIIGHKSLWRTGISGTALQFDGYNTVINHPAANGPKLTSQISLEGWVAIGAYPWSYVPIIQQSDDVPEEIEELRGNRALLIGEEGRDKEPEDEDDDFRVVIKKENDVGYFFGLDGYGKPVLKLRVGGKWEELTANVHLERRQWYQVAATYDKQTGKMALYVNGDAAGEKIVAKADIELSQKDIQIGKGKKRRPINPVRANTFMDSYSLDGLLDEVRIYDVALSPEQIAQSYANYKPSPEISSNPEMDKRVLPAGKNAQTFGAYYSQLKFYDIWDNLWRFGVHPDVVVEFDELPSKFVFWRGVGFIPMMVNEKGQWYSNEFNETWNKSGGQGCQEPMSDKESYTNHAKILENTDARVVVQWRYPLVDVLHVIANYNENTGWGDWADWYYYIYPDGIAVKKMHLWTNGERNHEWQESMAIFGPDQHPEQIIETRNALSMVDLKGNYVDYHWIKGPPPNVDRPKNKCIQYINYTGEYDPVTIGLFMGSNVYGGEVTPYAVFPTWNHWPVGQMPSDGRYASFPDRTAHSSLTHVFPPIYAEDFGDRPYYQKLLMEGMLKVNKSVELVPLARSWLQAPELTIKSGGETKGYDQTQRAYILTASDNNIAFSINASKENPIYNACFVVKNWGGDTKASLNLNGIEANFRQGVIRDTDGSKTLIIWVKHESTSVTEFEIIKG